MKFGLLFALRNLDPETKPQAEVYRDMLEQVCVAEDLGFDSVWMSEHHLVPDGYCPSVLVAAAAAAARTQTITIGTRVLLSPLHDPLRIAEDAAVTDLIAEGRFILGMGIGYKGDEFQAFGVDIRKRGSIMDEQVEILKGAWGAEPFSFEGRHYRYDDVAVYPKPAQAGGPPIWLAARGGRAVDRAARVADGLHAAGDPQFYAEFVAAMERYNRDIGSFPIAESRQCWVGKTSDEAWRVAEPGVVHVQQHYAKWFGEAGDLPHDDQRPADPEEIRAVEFVGTPEQVVDQYQQLIEEVPYITHSIMHVPPGVEHQDVVKGLNLFAERVMPRLS